MTNKWFDDLLLHFETNSSYNKIQETTSKTKIELPSSHKKVSVAVIAEHQEAFLYHRMKGIKSDCFNFECKCGSMWSQLKMVSSNF